MTKNIGLHIACLQCDEVQPEIKVASEQLLAWRNGAKIQDCMPELSAEERELLVSSTCPSCFDRMFKPHEGDDFDFAGPPELYIG